MTLPPMATQGRAARRDAAGRAEQADAHALRAREAPGDSASSRAVPCRFPPAQRARAPCAGGAARRGEETVLLLPHGPGPPGAVKRPQRFPLQIAFAWRFCMGMQGA